MELPTPQISVVVPVFNEAGNAAVLARELSSVLQQIGRSYELIFVNDGSADATLSELQVVQTSEPRLRLIDLDGNFGEAAALCAGFHASRGELLVTLDGDGQNDPADIPQLIEELESRGALVATGWRQHRQENLTLRVLPSHIANWLIAQTTRLPVHDNGCGLKVYRRAIVETAQLPRGFNRFMPAIFGVRASQVVEVPVRDRRRQHGQSHYGLGRVIIVTRDLLALRLILHSQATGTDFSRPSAVLAALAIVPACAASATWIRALGLTTAVVAGLIFWNLRRWSTAQRAGVFRIRREI